MDFVSLETLDEANNFLKVFSSNSEAGDDWYSIGASTSLVGTADNYVWLNSGNRVNYKLPFAKDEPNNAGDEYCLTIGRKAYNISSFLFNDMNCFTKLNRFVCQDPPNCMPTTTTTTSTTTTSSEILQVN